MAFHALFETVRLAEKFKDGAAMGEAIKKSGGEGFIKKELSPLSERQIGSNEEGDAVIDSGTIVFILRVWIAVTSNGRPKWL